MSYSRDLSIRTVDGNKYSMHLDDTYHDRDLDSSSAKGCSLCTGK
jgi:hypothetical protein